MSVGRYARHTKPLEPATKEFFQPTSTGTEEVALGGHHGHRINDDEEYAYIEILVPHDYKGLHHFKVVFIAEADLTPMTLRVMSNYCQEGQYYYYHGGPAETEDFWINVEDNRRYDLPIDRCVNGNPLEPGDIIGIQVSRQAGQNTDAIILGARFRYYILLPGAHGV